MDWNLTVIWIILAIVLAIVEALTVGLVVIWFAIGAVAAAIVSTVTDTIIIQIIVFIVISIIALILTKPLVNKWKTKVVPTNADRLIGAKGIITEDVNPFENTGQVKVLGQIWSCKSETGNTIKKSEIVEITKIEGVKAIVKKI